MSHKKDHLESLFGQTKAKVLKLFLHHPHLTLPANAVAQKIRTKNKEVESILGEIVKLGILKKINNAKTKKKN